MPDAPLCAYCRERPVSEAWRPFCSKRCQMADLGRWLSGEYRVPAGPTESDGSPTRNDDDDDFDER
jgi:hypothetical protein